MAITTWPDDAPLQEYVLCVVCNCRVPSSQVTMGVSCHDGTPAFICDCHLVPGRSHQLIRGWIDFALVEYNNSDVSSR